MELYQEQSQFTHDLALLLNHIIMSGYYCTLGEAYRTPEQAELDAKKGIGIVHSLHTKRLAIDLNLFDKSGKFLDSSDAHAPFGKYWESLDSKNRWGGNFSTMKDGNHYERRVIS